MSRTQSRTSGRVGCMKEQRASQNHQPLEELSWSENRFYSVDVFSLCSVQSFCCCVSRFLILMVHQGDFPIWTVVRNLRWRKGPASQLIWYCRVPSAWWRDTEHTKSPPRTNSPLQLKGEIQSFPWKVTAEIGQAERSTPAAYRSHPDQAWWQLPFWLNP